MSESTSHFPLFVDLTGRPCVIVGGGAIAARRAEVLARFGGAVTVIAPTWRGGVSGVRWERRTYRSGDLDGASLAVAATDDRAVNRQVGEEARALGIPVSVADCREECSFFFPAVCEGGGVTAGLVSRGGRDHGRTARAARAVRKTLEGLE